MSGSTASMAYVTDKHIITANVGDSRTIMYNEHSGVRQLTFDHKPDQEKEVERITKAGYTMTNDRINTKEGDGSLGVSRSFGDYKYKGFTPKQTDMAVSCEPDVCIYDRKEGDKFVFIACDGIWDVKTCQQAADFINDKWD